MPKFSIMKPKNNFLMIELMLLIKSFLTDILSLRSPSLIELLTRCASDVFSSISYQLSPSLIDGWLFDQSPNRQSEDPNHITRRHFITFEFSAECLCFPLGFRDSSLTPGLIAYSEMDPIMTDTK